MVRRTYLVETGFCFAKEIILAKLRSDLHSKRS